MPRLTRGAIDSLRLVKEHSELSRKLLYGISDIKKNREAGSQDIEHCERIILDILRSIITETKFTSNSQDIEHWRMPLRDVISPAVKTATDLLALCFDFDAQSLAPSLLDKLLVHVSSSTDATHSTGIERVLVPIIPRIKEFLLRHGQGLSTEPYQSFTAKVLNDFVKIVLGPRPPETVSLAEIKAVGCGCGNCRLLTSFFFGVESVLRIQEKASVRKHLEQQLEATRRWGVQWKSMNWTSPETIQVTKPMSLEVTIDWTKKQERGLKFMQSVGTAAELSVILGSDFTFVANALGLRTPLSVKALGGNRSNVPSARGFGTFDGPHKGSCGSKRWSTGSSDAQKRMKFDDDAGEIID